MLLRSVIAVLLSIPATTALIGVLLVLAPPHESLLMSLLLMAFPCWVLVASAAYMLPRPATSAAMLIAVSVVCFGLIAAIKYTGLSAI